MSIQIKSILKMRCSKILFIVLVILNLVSMVKSSDDVNITTDINNKIQETLSLKRQISNLRTIYQNEDDENWDNFFKYCDWKIKYLERMEKSTRISSYNQENYYKDTLILSSIDMNCYANSRIGDDVFDKIKPDYWNFKLKCDFDMDTLNEIYAKSNTSTFIHQRYVDEVRKMNLLYQRVTYNSYIDNDSVIGHLINILKADSLISFLIPIALMVFTYFVLQVYQYNNLHQLYLTQNNSRNRYFLNLIFSIVITFVFLYFSSFILTSVLLVKNPQHTWLNTKVLMDQEHVLSRTSYVHSPEKMYYLGNEYYASSYTLFTIPESLKLVSLWKVFLFTGSIEMLKLLFYICLSFLCFYVAYRNEKGKFILIFSFVILYIASQFVLLFPMLNPFAIVSSYSLVCGGYEITWLYGIILFLIYIVFETVVLKSIIRNVDL